MNNTVHMTLQGKGGVGKSLISSLIAQHQRERGQSVVCIDTDPVNATMTGYRAFEARRIELMEGASLNARKFDEMMEMLLTGEATFVVDNGASSFIPLSHYMIENSAVDMLVGAGKKVVIHTVITGGQALFDTLTGFDSLAQEMPAAAQIVVWLNEYFGGIEADGKTFEQMAAYQAHKGRVHGLVKIPRQTADTFGKDVELMLDKKLTFAEVQSNPEFGVMAKQRLAMVKRTIFQQLDAVL